MSEADLRRDLGGIFAQRLPRSWSDFDLERFPVANYIVFKDALGPSIETAATALRQARRHLNSHGIDPLFMIDEEGGRVTQLSDFLATAPSPRAIARHLTADEAVLLYAHQAAALAMLGIDVNLFPCLDVSTAPVNPIIGTRSFGFRAEDVSKFAGSVLQAYRGGPALVGKHFPGHGMTDVDSHLDLPAVAEPAELLKTVHIFPFRNAIAAGIDGIMVSHCTYTTLQDDDLPASLSRQVIVDQLRGRCGFKGPVISDSLDMQAVTRSLDPLRAARLAVEATCDILLYTEYSERFEEAFEGLVGHIAGGGIDPDTIRASIMRRDRLKRRRQGADGDTGTARRLKSMPGLELTTRVRDRAFGIDDPRHILPLSPGRIVIAGTHPNIGDRLRDRIPEIDVAKSPSDAANTVLLVWLMEPLRPVPALAEIADLIEASSVRILVTTYRALVEHLPACDATLIVDDTSPVAVTHILDTLFRPQRPAEV